MPWPEDEGFSRGLGKLRLAVGWVVVGAFVLSIAYSIVASVTDHHFDPEILYASQALMGVLAGAFFAKDLIGRRK